MKKSDSVLWHVTDQTIEKIMSDVRKNHSSREEFNELLGKVNEICPGLQFLHKCAVAGLTVNDEKLVAQCGVVLNLLLELYSIEQGIKLEKDLNG